MGVAYDYGDSHRKLRTRRMCCLRGGSLRQRASFVHAAAWLLIVACAGTLRLQAQERGEPGATATILALENAWSDAESRDDSHALERIFDNALVKIEDGRLVTKGECLSRVRQAASHPRQIMAKETTVHIFGSTAIVVGTYRETSVKNGKTLQKQWRFIDTWVKKKGEWVLVAAGAALLSR